VHGGFQDHGAAGTGTQGPLRERNSQKSGTRVSRQVDSGAAELSKGSYPD
jgi:hypothetical protein